MSVYANKKTRGYFIAAVSIFNARFKAPSYAIDPHGSTVAQADYVRRIVLMAGAIPALLTYYWRMKMRENYTIHGSGCQESKTRCSRHVKKLKIQKLKLELGLELEMDLVYSPRSFFVTGFRLLGTKTTRFFLDTLFYSQNLFQNMIQSFVVVLCALTFFFANFRPNATAFVAPAEIFPARLRTTCHGISAASGKLGAIVGGIEFLYLSRNKDKAGTAAGYRPGIGMRNSLNVLAVINLSGALFTQPIGMFCKQKPIDCT
ncbi:unnamed protein product [Coffea canephora]|uniref:Major facilitator superfamily (MFS) profile domain-containing protein n=1 Tax=Coffea canephora TaxID=49390 RepID=A0A068UHI0_COFCA|nr:unnamed protein product [Coffea canephora]